MWTIIKNIFWSLIAISFISGVIYQFFHTPQVEKAATQYVEELSEARDLARSIKDVATARASAPRLQELLRDMERLMSGLENTQIRAGAASRIEQQLEASQPILDELRGQLRRINASPQLAKVIGAVTVP